MAVYNLPNYKTADGFGMSLNIRRGNPNPLDNSSVWSSYDDALNYAKTSPVAYVGQLITVVEFTEAVMDGETVTTPAQAKVDVYKIELGDDGIGTLTKVGAEEAEAAIGEIEQEIGGIRADLDETNTNVTALGERLTPVETDLGTAKEDIAKAKEDIATNADDIATINDEIEQIKSDASELSGTVGSHNTRISTLETEKANYALKTEVATAKQEAIDAAVKAVLFDGDNDDAIANAYDTIKEIAEWIASDATASTELVGRVKAIEDDYLKGTDKTQLQTAINELSIFVGNLPEGATSKNVVDYINEVVAALKIGDYAKAADLTALAGRVKTLEDKQITPSDVIGLQNLLDGKVDTKSEEYTNSDGVTATVAHRLITPAEQDKLAKLAFDEDGKVTTGQQVAAGDVIGLADWLKTNGNTYIQDLGEDNLNDYLITKLNSAIKEIKVGDTSLTVTDGKVELPFATSTQYGIVKLGNEFEVNDTTGALEISSLNTNKLVQTTGEYLELNGGSANGFES